MAPRAKSTDGKAPRKPLAAKPNTVVGRRLASKPKSIRSKAFSTDQSDQIQILFRFAHEVGAIISCLTPLERCPKDLVTLTVDPKQPIRDLKLMLRYHLRIPFYENFKLSRDDYQDSSTLHDCGVKDQDTVWIITEGFSLDPVFYRKFLEERCDNGFPHGRPKNDFPKTQLLKIVCKLAHTLNRVEVDPLDSVDIKVDPKMPIGLLKIKLRCQLWIPFYENFELAQLCGHVLNHGDRSTLHEYGVKDEETLLVLMEGFPLDRSLLFERSIVEFPMGEPKKIQIFVKSAHYIDEFWRFPERSDDRRHVVRLIVEPTLTIGALKSMLQPNYWIPKENFVLFSEPTELNDGSTSAYGSITIFNNDCSTLDECGVKGGHTLMSCGEDGSFQIKFYDYERRKSLPVSVSSCFQTIQDLKIEIERVKDYGRDYQVWTDANGDILGNGTPLVVLGIVKPFMELMESNCHALKLRMVRINQKGRNVRFKQVA